MFHNLDQRLTVRFCIAVNPLPQDDRFDFEVVGQILIGPDVGLGFQEKVNLELRVYPVQCLGLFPRTQKMRFLPLRFQNFRFLLHETILRIF